MNLVAKPISSPGRPEKYPPPLMRFLRSSAASKSRGKSRSNSPMFIKKNNNEPQQEPTSPKVTCIGQVRSKARTGLVKPESTRPYSCWKIKTPKPLFFCPNLGKSLRPRLVKPNWRKWVLFFRCGYCRKSEIMADSVKSEQDDEEIDMEIETNVEPAVDLGSTCPPKNALLLTRCRSAPYRSSSLASRFWAISETVEKTEDFENGGSEYQPLEKRETEEPISETEDLRKVEENSGDLKIIGSLIGRSSEEKGENLGDLISRKSEEIAQSRAQPVMLVRCKSEPAKTGERLDPNFMVN